MRFFQQLEEIHRKRQVEMTTTAREMERTYESRLQEQLQAMRAEFDDRLNRNRRDIDETYKVELFYLFDFVTVICQSKKTGSFQCDF